MRNGDNCQLIEGFCCTVDYRQCCVELLNSIIKLLAAPSSQMSSQKSGGQCFSYVAVVEQSMPTCVCHETVQQQHIDY